MDRITKFLSGTKILAEVNSKYNGPIEVVTDIAWGKHIVVDGLTQSGGVTNMVWKNTLKQLKNKKITSCLIVGLGGGTIAKIIREKYREAKIIGVDIDKEFVELGKKYLDLESQNVEIHIEDAIEYLKSEKRKFDLVVVDIFNGRSIPNEFNKADFANLIKKHLSDEGLAIFNRLYYGEKRLDAVKFLRVLEREFREVNPFYPEANIMLLCKK